MGVEGEPSSKLEETECTNVTPSESDNSIDYRQYTESLPIMNSTLPEELLPNPSSSAHGSRSKWTSSLSPIGSRGNPLPFPVVINHYWLAYLRKSRTVDDENFKRNNYQRKLKEVLE